MLYRYNNNNNNKYLNGLVSNKNLFIINFDN